MGKKRFAKRAAQTVCTKPSATAINKEARASRRGTKRKTQIRKAKRAILLTSLSELQKERERDVDKREKGVFALLKDDLDDALERCEEQAGGGREDEGKKSQMCSRGRRALAAKEGAHLARVRAHSAFRENPMEALRMHLSNSVCADAMEVAEGDTVLGDRSGARRKHDGGTALVASDKAVREARALAREEVLKKRAHRQRMANKVEEARRVRREQGRVEKQSAEALLGGQHGARTERYDSSTQRGGIGQKRAKI
ncbi:hypothetical protein BWQ96_03276 [Gracilariopsis chorda]|uniref:Uncharacterized protein n=1 Tax=Gracilariopsis chorda TaxID=448386 RepID=A0A2V3IXR1_9FLOR|nr:hypothetical protein BWQ96_03276 [Gracilariopsis chorda]|eukprot:PXF46938.1 hypothetical protein BWQ96_03276 [Gracilariopsis chorda]